MQKKKKIRVFCPRHIHICKEQHLNDLSRLYLYMHMPTYIPTYIYTHVYMHVHTYVYVHIHTYECAFVYNN